MCEQVSAMREERLHTTELREQIKGLRQMTIAGLKRKYFEVFGAESRFNHKQLFRRVAWRIQFSESAALPSSRIHLSVWTERS
jgi:hypothetical protein